jgi:hypothetical protein
MKFEVEIPSHIKQVGTYVVTPLYECLICGASFSGEYDWNGLKSLECPTGCFRKEA